MHADGTSWIGCMPKARLRPDACRWHVLDWMHAEGTSKTRCMPMARLRLDACRRHVLDHGLPARSGSVHVGSQGSWGKVKGGGWVLGGPYRSLRKMSLRVRIASHCAWSPRAKTRASRSSTERPGAVILSSARASVSAPYADSMVSPAGGAAVAASTPADSAEDERRAWARA
jgi:hypothetical protein